MTNNNQDWRVIGGSDFPPAYKFVEIGQQVTGEFISYKRVESEKFANGSADFIQLDISIDSRDKVIGTHSIICSGLLKYLVEQADLKSGQLIRITYLGKKPVKIDKKKVNCNQYTLEVKD